MSWVGGVRQCINERGRQVSDEGIIVRVLYVRG